MARRDDDYRKLLNYARIMGVKVRHVDSIEDNCVGLYTAPEEDSPPEVFIKSYKRSKVLQLITLIHELAHHLDFLEKPFTVEECEAQALFGDKGSKAPKWAKDLVWDGEERAHKRMPDLVKLLDIKISPFHFEYDMECHRKFLQESFKNDKITDSQWREIKKETRQEVKRKLECQKKRSTKK